jgi:hypothetical protein
MRIRWVELHIARDIVGTPSDEETAVELITVETVK